MKIIGDKIGVDRLSIKVLEINFVFGMERLQGKICVYYLYFDVLLYNHYFIIRYTEERERQALLSPPGRDSPCSFLPLGGKGNKTEDPSTPNIPVVQPLVSTQVKKHYIIIYLYLGFIYYKICLQIHVTFKFCFESSMI